MDERVVAPEGRFEVIEGQVMECAPSDEPHGTTHSRVDYVLHAHARASFDVAVDMLTRSNRFSDMAPDVSVFPKARDPVTGGRKLEHIALEICDSQSVSAVTPKARLLIQRGVRRVLCVEIPRERVLEWDSARDEWVELDRRSEIRDRTCFVRAVAVEALLQAMQADNSVAAALLAKKNPVLQKAVEAGRERGLEEGLEKGLEKGMAEGRLVEVKSLIVRILMRRGLRIGQEQREKIETSTSLEQLEHWLDEAMTAASAAEALR